MWGSNDMLKANGERLTKLLVSADSGALVVFKQEQSSQILRPKS